MFRVLVAVALYLCVSRGSAYFFSSNSSFPQEEETSFQEEAVQLQRDGVEGFGAAARRKGGGEEEKPMVVNNKENLPSREDVEENDLHVVPSGDIKLENEHLALRFSKKAMPSDPSRFSLVCSEMFNVAKKNFQQKKKTGESLHQNNKKNNGENDEDKSLYKLKCYPELFILGFKELTFNSSLCAIQEIGFPGDGAESVLVKFDCPEGILVDWGVSLNPHEHYARYSLQWRSPRMALTPNFIGSLVLDSAGILGTGRVYGNPLISEKSLFFAGLESPMSANGPVNGMVQTALCGLVALPVTPKDSYSILYKTVVGVAEESSQIRRAFNRYLDMVRAHPTRPFLHYNSWFDFVSWQEPNATSYEDRKMTEDSCLSRVRDFGEELVVKRNVKLDSFLWDDGWDDPKSLWDFHSAFPNGFTNIGEKANQYGSGIGVWISPWGGYGEAKEERLKFARAQGYETNKMGFSLSGPKYSKRFREIALTMVKEYGVNMFKFDGITFMGKSNNDFALELESMLEFLLQLRREAKSSLFINLTTGTWPSPFWFLYVDSVWRGNRDLGIHADGSYRQQWISFRDTVTFDSVVTQARFFPLSSIMLHGIVAGAVGESRFVTLDKIKISEFKEEVWSYFGMGVNLQELYISPDVMNPEAWDVVAEGSKWARANNAILQDAHWIGGDPIHLQVYGTGSFSPQKSILYLRNPANQTQTVTLQLNSMLEVPTEFQNRRASLKCAFSSDGVCVENKLFKDGKLVCPQGDCQIDMHETFILLMMPLRVLIIEAEHI